MESYPGYPDPYPQAAMESMDIEIYWCLWNEMVYGPIGCSKWAPLNHRTETTPQQKSQHKLAMNMSMMSQGRSNV
jgi:hypothetical protein